MLHEIQKTQENGDVLIYSFLEGGNGGYMIANVTTNNMVFIEGK